MEYTRVSGQGRISPCPLTLSFYNKIQSFSIAHASDRPLLIGAVHLHIRIFQSSQNFCILSFFWTSCKCKTQDYCHSYNQNLTTFYSLKKISHIVLFTSLLVNTKTLILTQSVYQSKSLDIFISFYDIPLFFYWNSYDFPTKWEG